MLIRRMSARFGCLDNAELSLKPGLNILRAPNESGKSTWCAFIRCMLYGVDSKGRVRGGELPDKLRYAPWSGGSMEGRMDVEWEGRKLSLSRTSPQSSLPMRDFSALDTENGQVCSELHANDAGEQLCHAAAAVFERTAFIGSLTAVDNTAELEARIASILSAPSADRSYAETAETLREWQRRHANRGKGQLAELNAQLESKKQELFAWRACRDETLSLEKACNEAERSHEEQLSSQNEALRARLETARKKAADLEGSAAQLEKQCAAMRETLQRSPFSRKGAAEKANAAALDAETLMSADRGNRLLVPALLCAILGLAAMWWNVWIGVLFFLGSLTMFSLMIYLSRRARLSRRRAKRMLAHFGADSAEKLRQLLWEYENLERRLHRDGSYAHSARLEAEAARREAEELEQQAMESGGQDSRKALEAAREALYRSRGRLEGMSPGETLAREYRQLEARRAEEEKKLSSLLIAASLMEEANEELRRRYSPALAEKTAEYFSRLTLGKYSEVILQQELSALLLPAGESVRRQSSCLSLGTQHQLALALRLALCGLLLGGEDGCPLILDDALISFDDERLDAAMALLREIGEERQILLFTCSDREERALQRLDSGKR